MPPLTPSKELRDVTFHNDGFWYAVGFDTSNPTSFYIMKSSDSFGFNWENYLFTGDTILDALFSINSINGRLVIGGRSAQYQIINNVCTRYDTTDRSWNDNVKDGNTNGFDMAGQRNSPIAGAYSNF